MLCDAIVRKGGIPFVTKEDDERVRNWPNYYKTKRKTEIFTGRQLLDKKQAIKIKEEYGDKIFFKTLQKNFSDIILADYLIDSESLLSRTIKEHKEEKFIISEVVDRKKDELGIIEYRVFVVGGRIKSISRYTLSKLHRIDKKVFDRIFEIVNSIENFPKDYVVDIFEYEKDGETELDVVEFNNVTTAGTYLYNSKLDFSGENILHDDINRIGEEKGWALNKSLNYKYKDGTGSRFFNHPGSFAGDLESIYLYGMPGWMVIHGMIDLDFKHLGMHGSLCDASKHFNKKEGEIFSDSKEKSTELPNDDVSYIKKNPNN